MFAQPALPDAVVPRDQQAVEAVLVHEIARRSRGAARTRRRRTSARLVAARGRSGTDSGCLSIVVCKLVAHDRSSHGASRAWRPVTVRHQVAPAAAPWSAAAFDVRRATTDRAAPELIVLVAVEHSTRWPPRASSAAPSFGQAALEVQRVVVGRRCRGMPWTQRGRSMACCEVAAAVDESDEHLEVRLDLSSPAGRGAGDDRAVGPLDDVTVQACASARLTADETVRLRAGSTNRLARRSLRTMPASGTSSREPNSLNSEWMNEMVAPSGAVTAKDVVSLAGGLSGRVAAEIVAAAAAGRPTRRETRRRARRGSRTTRGSPSIGRTRAEDELLQAHERCP